MQISRKQVSAVHVVITTLSKQDVEARSCDSVHSEMLYNEVLLADVILHSCLLVPDNSSKLRVARVYKTVSI